MKREGIGSLSSMTLGLMSFWVHYRERLLLLLLTKHTVMSHFKIFHNIRITEMGEQPLLSFACVTHERKKCAVSLLSHGWWEISLSVDHLLS